jgi:hypothetical protein
MVLKVGLKMEMVRERVGEENQREISRRKLC